MNKRIIICVLCSLLTVSVWAQDTLRIMTINVHQGSDTTLQAIGEFIKQYHPDLVALQELDMWPKRSEAPKQFGKNFIAELSYYTDMMGFFGKAWDHPGGWKYGNGILSKYQVDKIENFILPQDKSVPAIEPRQIIIAHININGRNICFASTHLCYKYKENRMKQMKYIHKLMSKQTENYQIVCGDFNAYLAENLVSKGMKKWHDILPLTCTFPSSGEAYFKFDYMLIPDNSNIQVLNTSLICDPGITDHCVCIADIVLP